MELKVYKLKDIAAKEGIPYQTLLWQKKQNPKLFLPVTITGIGKLKKTQIRFFDRETSKKLNKLK